MAKQLQNNIRVFGNDKLTLKFPDPSFKAIHHKIIDQYKNDLTKWLPWVKQLKSEKDHEDFIENAILMNQLKRACVCFIFENDQLIGSIALNKIDPKINHAGMGFWLIPPKRGQGIMTQVASSFIAYAFNTYPIQCISIQVIANNTKSINIARKLGFRQEVQNISFQSSENQLTTPMAFTLNR